MDIWHDLEDIPADCGPAVITIGVFDGVHRGHRRLIGAAVRQARHLGLPCIMMTFAPHPMSVIAPDRVPQLLGSMAERAHFANELGVNHLLALTFDKDLAALSPDDFVQHILVERLGAAAVVVGENFTYGHKAAGETETLKESGKQLGFDVDVIPLLAEDGHVLSSSFIRSCLSEGRVDEAAWALGRPFSVTSEIERGAGRGGRELGYPTANLYIDESRATPRDGVYAGWLTVIDNGEIDGDMSPGHRYPAAISVGNNPTFDDPRRSVEAFVLDHEADLYGREATVEFTEFVRPVVAFNSVDELIAGIDHDVKVTRERLGIAPSDA